VLAAVAILTQFIFRISFGMALGMALVPPRLVSSGYYRNHLYVLLGLNVLATMVALSAPGEYALWPPLAASMLSYAGAVCWLYEKPRPGIAALALLAAVTLAGAWLAEKSSPANAQAAAVLRLLDPITSGLVLGLTIAAMFLGHWYLNAPGMALAPLRRLILLMAIAIAARAIQCGLGLGLELSQSGWPASERVLFVSLRWLSGLIGAEILAWMTWQTLKIPNTQSATGILYVAVIATFLGELTSMLLSVQTVFPL